VELSIIVPCLDEEACLPPLLDRLEAMLEANAFVSRGGAEVIFVDDGSTDATWAILESAVRERGFVRAYRHERNRGLVVAWRTGVTHARGRLVCTFDADLQYLPEDIPLLYRALESTGADLVQGSRTERRDRGPRLLMSRCLSTLLNVMFGMKLADNKSGFVMCHRHVLTDLFSYRGRYAHWQILLLVAAHAKGYRIHEVPARFDARLAGHSFLSDLPAQVVLHVLADLVRGVVEYRLGL
jgi:glycosyltransferase involved in cell wall biosynthesis